MFGLKSLKTAKITLYNERERTPLRIVGDAGIATPSWVGGRMVPLLIVDTHDRPDVDEYIRLHDHLNAGDVIIQWVKIDPGPSSIDLVLNFRRPAELVAIIKFELERNHSILVEHALNARALFLQAGRPGDRYLTTQDASRIWVEVPDTGARPAWEKLHREWVVRHFRREGLSRAAARRAADSAISELKRIVSFRMGA